MYLRDFAESEISEQTGAREKIFNYENMTEDIYNIVLFSSTKNNDNSWYQPKNHIFLNKAFLDYFLVKKKCTLKDGEKEFSENLIEKMHSAIMNKNFGEFLKNEYPDNFEEIEPNKETFVKYIYKKRIYNSTSMLLNISNISFLQFYHINKDRIAQILDEGEKEHENVWEVGYLDDSECGKKLKTIFKEFNNYKKSDVPVDKDLDAAVEDAVDDLIDIISSPNYFEDEFDSYILPLCFSLLVDHLVASKNKKELNKLFLALHEAGNSKNKLFYKTVYGGDLHSKKPFYLFTNHPGLLYYYFLFYKSYSKGKYFNKLVKHNLLILLVLTLKNANGSSLEISQILPKLEKLFDKYSPIKNYNLSTFLHIDTLLTSSDITLILDILEQNMDLLKLILLNTSNYYYYAYSKIFIYRMRDADFIRHLVISKLVNNTNSKRFWNIIQSFLLNYKMSYSQKKKILKSLKEFNICGFDEDFIANAPNELQTIICELLIE